MGAHHRGLYREHRFSCTAPAATPAARIVRHPVLSMEGTEAGPSAPSASFRVLSWNILAHIHTHYNHLGHGGAPKERESEKQRTARYRQIARTITELSPDIALLQEVDSFFMPQDWQAEQGALPCGESLDGYTPYRSYSDREEGTVILLRDATFTRDTSIDATYIPATKQTGWKTGMVLHAIRRGDVEHRIAICSVHLKWGAPEAQLALVTHALEQMQPDCPAILGGDFNVEPADLKPLQAAFWKHGLERVATADGVPTGLSGSLKWHAAHTIDHIFVRAPLFIAAPIEVGPLPQEHSNGPWGEGPHSGSDHAPLLAQCKLPS